MHLLRNHLLCVLSKYNKNVHIINHLYFENQRKRGKEPNSDIWKRFCQPGNSHCDSLQKTLMIVRFFFFFCNTSAYSVEKNWKKDFWVLALSLIAQTSICYLWNTAQNILKSRWMCGKKQWKTMHAMKPVPQTGNFWHQFLWLSHCNNLDPALL